MPIVSAHFRSLHSRRRRHIIRDNRRWCGRSGSSALDCRRRHRRRHRHSATRTDKFRSLASTAPTTDRRPTLDGPVTTRYPPVHLQALAYTTPDEARGKPRAKSCVGEEADMFCSVAALDPHGRTFSIYLRPLSFRLTLPWGRGPI